MCFVNKNSLLAYLRVLPRLHPATDISHGWAVERWKAGGARAGDVRMHKVCSFKSKTINVNDSKF